MFPWRRRGLFIKGKQEEQHTGMVSFDINMGTTPNKMKGGKKQEKTVEKMIKTRRES